MYHVLIFMSKKVFFLFFILLLLNNCASSSAFLGPIFTAAKTGSVYQASLSYGSNIIFKELKNSNKTINEDKDETPKITKINPDIILITLKTYEIEISEVFDPEPLP